MLHYVQFRLPLSIHLSSISYNQSHQFCIPCEIGHTDSVTLAWSVMW